MCNCGKNTTTVKPKEPTITKNTNGSVRIGG